MEERIIMCKKSSFSILFLVILSVLASGCGTIIYGTHQELSLNTHPSGEIARVGTQSCVTPCTLTVSRKADHVYITEGGVETEYNLDKSLNGFTLFIGNILWGIIPGIIVDGSSGGNHTIKPVDIFSSTITKHS